MPIVPTMTAPTVQEHVGGAPHIQAHIPSSQSYERTFATAMKTLNDGIDTAVKAMEVADARYIKAQSDDAETQIMNAINTTLYDKDNGYFTKQGKNAIDSYADTEKALKEQVKGVTDKLDPRVVQALQSRIDQRMMSVNQSMQRWYASQAGQYNLHATKSKLESLASDISNNYANTEYVSKSFADADAQIAYIGKLQGLDEETLKNMRTQYWSNTQALRFQAWAEDDPSSALVAFRDMSDTMDPKVRMRVEKNLENQFASNCADMLIGTKALDEMNPNIKTGIRAFDESDNATKRIMLAKADAMKKTQNREATIALSNGVKDQYVQIENEGVGSVNILGADDFIEVLGQKDGEKYYTETYLPTIYMKDSVHTFKTCDRATAESILEYMRPKPGDPDYEKKNIRYKSALSAWDHVTKSRSADPVADAIATEPDRYQPLPNVGDSSFEDALKNRVNNISYLAQRNGVKSTNVFTNAEFSNISAQFNSDTITYEQKTQLAQRIAYAAGDYGIQSIINQARQKSNGKVPDWCVGLASEGFAGLYFEGKHAIATKSLGSYNSNGVELALNKIKPVVDSMFQTEFERDSTIDLVRGIVAQKIKTEQRVPKAEDILDMVSGGKVSKVHGKQIAIPNFATDDDVSKWMVTGLAKIIYDNKKGFGLNTADGTYPTNQFIEDLPSNVVKLQTWKRTPNGMKYFVLVDGQYVFDKRTKKRFYVELNPETLRMTNTSDPVEESDDDLINEE